MVSRRALIAACILLMTAGMDSVEGTRARWDAMDTPRVLGRDESTLALFPAIGADLERGFYGQTSPRYGVWWVHRFGSLRSHIGSLGNEEMRFGLAGGGEAFAIGLQGFYSRDQDTYGDLAVSDDRFRGDRTDTESDRYSLILSGAWKKRDVLTVDVVASLGYEDRRRDLFAYDIRSGDTTFVEITTDGVLAPAWSFGGRIAGSAGGGKIIAWFQWSERRAPEKLERLSGFDSPPEGFDYDGDAYEGVLGWKGPVSDLDLFTAGIGGDYVETREVSSDAYRLVEDRRSIEWSAFLFMGAEERLKPWLVARGGFRQDYSSRRFHRMSLERDGYRRYLEDRNDGFGAFPDLEVGVGVEHGGFQADVHISVGYLLDNPVRKASLRYTF